MKKHKCIFPKCITILRQDNKGKFCSLHSRILIQNDILFWRDKFYRCGCGLKKNLMTKKEILSLKELEIDEETLSLLREEAD